MATSNVALISDYSVEFVDINLQTGNICPDLLEKKLSITKKNRIPSVLIVVHYAGLPCDMKAIYKLSKKFNFKIIEDASHALGALYEKGKVGNLKYSDACVFSFHPVKMITTGEGGAIMLKNYKFFNKAKALVSHGIVKNKKALINKKMSNLPWYFEQQYLSLNFRLTDFQAALGLSQLSRLNKFLIKRKKITQIYNKELNREYLHTQEITNGKKIYSSNHLYIVRLKDDKIKKKIYDAMKKKVIF